jgi:signal transduction histidine kinase
MKLLGLTNNLLSWASLQTGRMAPEPEELQLNSILEKNASLFEQSAIQKNIKLKVQNNEDAIIYADPDIVDTVVRNLISNALKFTPSGRIIELSLRVMGRKVLLKVKDNGIGMNEHTLANLFNIEKITSRTGTADEQGSGLGLLLCQEMVEKNNGTLTVNSKIGEGTIVGIEFSIYKKDIE